MEFRPIPRPSESFQQPVTVDEIEAICRRAFGTHTKVLSAAELGTGMYNTTLKVTIADQERPVILRIAPEPDRQFTSERALMRNEYASMPYLADLAPLMPRLITVDFTHEIIGRDYMVQTLLDGIPATEHLRTYPRSTWPTYYRQLGEIARRVHAVRGPCFGPLAGPAYGTWSDAVAASLEDIAADLEGAGLDAGDVRKVVAAALRHRTVLDEITEPRLLGGDLWIPNTLLDHDAAEPTINGVYDFDRTWWGDPAADWTIRMVTAKADERTTFWDTYGPLDQSESAQWRQKVYEARHLGAIRLERHRLGNREGVRASYGSIADILAIVG
ncbi:MULTISPECIES: phosphotransferase family protein [unclassified Streptomyces]|uniref:phosphotransferase family protein n=1 Tax=unclassified Streptomyces TaxID=2593676 RepID=UPI001165AE5B|nr:MULTISPECIES: aminoglycoside phosphotransferase family protein [unclassified Streptomyces]NMI55840.1 aminoglycoside phosphotransferase family protein [Streptomyces sp. RLA2-12]QDN55314.1 aminoglycoside phosphotransferase family protein [Streptomyces sp. S1D4-20]QDN65493.1 aminoglycoside phosphotransferase family protein [Streptomyces sp. S1D4-14]QDN96133.1 aminoglycoside phosphotransferase family protein [Streptomyces sp. RLB1-9]QDO17838.1 aminoglycoside phosphotransferase family protein [S